MQFMHFYGIPEVVPYRWKATQELTLIWIRGEAREGTILAERFVVESERVNSSQILILAGWTVINGRRTVGFDYR